MVKRETAATLESSNLAGERDPFAPATRPPGGRLERRRPSPGDDGLVSSLGWFSVGLGLTQLVAPTLLCDLIGVRPRPLFVRLACGLRELGVGVGLLSSDRPAPYLWSRVLGDAFDLSLLVNAAADRRSDRARVSLAAASVLGVAALDTVAAVRSSRGGRSGRALRVVKSIAINRTPAECYAFWRELENLPRFLTHVESVVQDGHRSHWIVRGPAGRPVEWDAQLVTDELDTLIAWRSLPGGDVDTVGSVSFAPRPGKGTIVRVSMEYRPPAGALGALVAKLFVTAPDQQLKDDLRRLKQVLECGEVLRTEGQPSCRRSLGHRALAHYFTGGES